MARSRVFIFIALLLNFALIAGVCIMAPRMYPLHHDTAANFWFATTEVDLGATRRFRHDFVIVDQGNFVYSSTYPFAMYNDLSYETISVEEAERDLPKVAAELARRAALHDAHDYYAEAYMQWMKLDPLPGSKYPSVTELFQFIDQSRSEWMIHQPLPPEIKPFAPPIRYRDFQTGLTRVPEVARLYWATCAFEVLLFSGIVWFLF